MKAETRFQSIFFKPPSILARAPGRVNLLGEHVDYNDGPVLPAAIDRSVRIAAARNIGHIVHLIALDLEEEVRFSLIELENKKDLQGNDLPSWALYPAAVAWSLQEAGLRVQGVQAVFTSDVPIGAGLSSSAAVEVAFAALWQGLGDWQVDSIRLARLCQRAENEYVGVQCGLMDQFASANGVAGHALYFDTRSLEWQAAPLPPGTALVIADSGVRRSLAASAYNERRAACEQAVEILQQYKPEIRSLRDISPVEFAAFAPYLPQTVRRRAEHVVKEIARVESALKALQRKDAPAFGALMYAGHASLRDLYEVSTPELDALVDYARQIPGNIGARLTGAGFGGCTVNLVEEGKAMDFIQALHDRYLQEIGSAAQIYLCQASAGASIDWMDNDL